MSSIWRYLTITLCQIKILGFAGFSSLSGNERRKTVGNHLSTPVTVVTAVTAYRGTPLRGYYVYTLPLPLYKTIAERVPSGLGASGDGGYYYVRPIAASTAASMMPERLWNPSRPSSETRRI